MFKAIPSARQSSPPRSGAFPARKKPSTSKPTSSTSLRACEVINYEVDLIIAVDSSNFDLDQFDTIIEGVGSLVDESFDLSPDVVRVGFIVYRSVIEPGSLFLFY